MSNKKDDVQQDNLFKNIQAMSKVLARYSQQNLALEIENELLKDKIEALQKEGDEEGGESDGS